MDCSTIKPVVGCWSKADGSFESVSIHYEYATAASGEPIVKSTRYTKADGSDIITVPAGDAVTVGACSAKLVVDVLAGSLGIIAGATRSATPAFTGAPATVNTAGITGKLQSITISAKGVTDGIASADSVTVTLANGQTIRLFDNQSIGWAVTRDQDDEMLDPITVTATGNAYDV